MAHPGLTAIVLLVFWLIITAIDNCMINNRKAVIRLIGYVIILILAIATLLFIFTQYLGIKF